MVLRTKFKTYRPKCWFFFIMWSKKRGGSARDRNYYTINFHNCTIGMKRKPFKRSEKISSNEINVLLLTGQPKLTVDPREESNEVKPGKANLSETITHTETKAIKTDKNSKTKNEKSLADRSQKALSSNRDAVKCPSSVNTVSLKNAGSSQQRQITFNQSKPAGQEEYHALLSRCKYFFCI